MTHGLRVWRADAEGRRQTELASLADQALLEYARQGETAAFAELYSRHKAAARRLARRIVGGRVEADDVVAETFARVLRVLRGGGGPVDGFRVYLLTAVRRTAWYLENRERRELAVEPFELDGPAHGADFELALAERGLMTRAFTSLPERWRTVLWHTEVEGEPARHVARILGISPNGVAALSYRARGALREAYLQAHVADPPTEGCRPFAAKLGGYTLTRGSSVDRAQVSAHLASCVDCRARAAELRDVRSTLRAAAAPALLGPAAAAYLAHGKLTIVFGALMQNGKVTAAATLSGAAASGEAITQIVAHHGKISAALAGAALTATGALGLVAVEPGPEGSSQRAVITAIVSHDGDAGRIADGGTRGSPGPDGIPGPNQTAADGGNGPTSVDAGGPVVPPDAGGGFGDGRSAGTGLDGGPLTTKSAADAGGSGTTGGGQLPPSNSVAPTGAGLNPSGTSAPAGVGGNGGGGSTQPSTGGGTGGTTLGASDAPAAGPTGGSTTPAGQGPSCTPPATGGPVSGTVAPTTCPSPSTSPTKG